MTASQAPKSETRPSKSRTRSAFVSHWRGVADETWSEIDRDNVSIVAAGVAFYAFSALVPLLTAFVLSYGLFADPALVVANIRSLAGMLPRDVLSIIADQLRSMIEADGKTGLALALALLVALYGASKGASSVMTALNIAWGVAETRGIVRRTWLGVAITSGAVLALLVGILAISCVAFVEALMPDLGGATHILVQIASLACAALAITLLLAAIYRYAPNRPNARWRWITPGSVLATIVWLAATFGFGVYVADFGDYNATYGSLGAIIVFLTWIYITAYVILVGAELNAVLEKRALNNDRTPGDAVKQTSLPSKMLAKHGKSLQIASRPTRSVWRTSRSMRRPWPNRLKSMEIGMSGDFVDAAVSNGVDQNARHVFEDDAGACGSNYARSRAGHVQPHADREASVIDRARDFRRARPIAAAALVGLLGIALLGTLRRR